MGRRRRMPQFREHLGIVDPMNVSPPDCYCSGSGALLWPLRGSPAQHLAVRHVSRTGQVDVTLDDDIRAEGDVTLDLQPRATAQ
jgi:hypothetical protein